ncbi:hypothetical protein FS837_008774 [Tulasnella sp. UAMH 9824]|nr:hypothetical protein FS837_008774 [Tulasnella sp. UAMH 9824]
MSLPDSATSSGRGKTQPPVADPENNHQWGTEARGSNNKTDPANEGRDKDQNVYVPPPSPPNQPPPPAPFSGPPK